LTLIDEPNTPFASIGASGIGASGIGASGIGARFGVAANLATR